ncbi:hypothetical protein [Haloarchaeobius sp. DFWS5]|uniref:hypothetical protein n=1 Tax=Haloarchaeobius sp. DFWS5 TaxID=3446114 RepID=UPI003EBE5DE3
MPETTETQSTQSQVSLDPHLVDRVTDRLQYTMFETVDDYVAYVLEETLATVEAETDDESESATSGEEVRSRLESLGYLD